MKNEKVSHVQLGLNEYRFSASLQIEHPTIDPGHMSTALALLPSISRRRGEQRTTPRGDHLLPGEYSKNFFTSELAISPGTDLPEFLDNFITELTANGTRLLLDIFRSGGSVSIFVGIFAIRCCDFEISPNTLKNLGGLGISLRLDYYNSTDEEPSGDCQKP